MREKIKASLDQLHKTHSEDLGVWFGDFALNDIITAIQEELGEVGRPKNPYTSVQTIVAKWAEPAHAVAVEEQRRLFLEHFKEKGDNTRASP